MVRTFVKALAVIGLLSLATGCGDKPSEDECSKLLDHIIKIEIEAAGTDSLTPEMKADLEKQKKAVRDYTQKQFMEQCVDKTPGKYVRCGLKAKNHQDLAACGQS